MKISRREFFLKSASAIALASTSGFITTFVNSCSSNNPTAPSNLSPLATIQASVANNEISISLDPSSPIINKDTRALVLYNNNSGAIIVEHNSDDSYKAISGICTHQGCIISNFEGSSNDFVCPCHNSKFDMNGNVVQGPASTNLAGYNTRVENNSLIITL